ncbi:MAG: ABC transporter substrate-binding protein [Gemmatimonadota bacterium]
MPPLLARFAALMAATAWGCGDGGTDSSRVAAGGDPDDRAGGLAVVCLEGQPESLNPFLSPDQFSADLASLLFTPLVRYGEDGEIEPYLAKEWSWDEAHQRLALEIRSDVEWHDGAPVSAEDVAWTLRTAANPDYGAWSGPDLETLLEATALDPVRVEIRFSTPFAAGLEPFVGIPILPHHLLGELDSEEFTRASYHREPIGSGPYRLVARNPDGSLAFERAPAFPEELGDAYLDRLIVRPIAEDVTRIAELRTGGADACVTGSAVADELQAVEGIEILPLEPSAVQVIVLDTRTPLFSEAAVRRALSASLVRDELAAVISPLARPARTELPPSSPWLEPATGQPDADPALADSLLEAAGWRPVDGGGTRLNAAGEELRFTITSPPLLRNLLTAVQGQLRRHGIQADLEFMEWASYVRRLQDPDARPEAMALTFVPERILHPDLSGTYASSSPMNIASYVSAAVDSVLDRLNAAMEREELKELYGALQRHLAEDVPILYTAYAPRLLAVGPRLRNVRPGIGSPLQFVTEWWIPRDARR